MTRPWAVLKYGGTSVASASNWQQILRRVEALRSTHRVWIVASAVSQVSNQLEHAINSALQGEGDEAIAWIRDTHRTLAVDLGLDRKAFAPCAALLEELERLLNGIRLVGEASPRLRARVMSFGELASTWLGLAALRQRGFAAHRVDARDLLLSEMSPSTPDATRYLEARCGLRRDPETAEARAPKAEVVITQGFICRTPEGHTALLGRGGSDTSAALFAALLGAARLEIWSDVHGMFTTDPRHLPSARLLRHVRYREAEELAAMGAKVLHPRCLGPARWAQVPIHLKNTRDPDAEGTVITAEGEEDPAVLAIVRRDRVPLVSVRTLAMWETPGFLSRVFAPFATAGVSVDLVATSQTTVTVTLDHVPGGLEGPAFKQLLADLEALGRVELIREAAQVSLVGRRIRTILPELGPALSALAEQRVHLVSASSEDLNLSFVVDPEDASRLVRDLHAQVFRSERGTPWLGPTWSELTGTGSAEAHTTKPWWVQRREQLIGLVGDGQPRYVYHLPTIAQRAGALIDQVPTIGQHYYAMKANAHRSVLELVARKGFGIECVSAAEVARARDVCGAIVPLLFTPNFCPVSEYADAFAAGADVVIDGPEVLVQAPDTFRGRAVGLRIDPGAGQGHHRKVRTAGAEQKFGLMIDDLPDLLAAASALDVRIVGLHAHVGSGIHDPGAWARTAQTLAALRPQLPDLAWIDVGGGLGVVDRPGQPPLDLEGVNTALAAVDGLSGLELRMEPGRYLVSEAGVLLAPVTQVRPKGGRSFVGLATGMNSLIRPALYGAWHNIHNLSRLGDPPAGTSDVVGPICETGDVLGRDRALPACHPGHVLLIENCGAYGAVMGSSYNLRAPAAEVALDV